MTPDSTMRASSALGKLLHHALHFFSPDQKKSALLCRSELAYQNRTVSIQKLKFSDAVEISKSKKKAIIQTVRYSYYHGCYMRGMFIFIIAILTSERARFERGRAKHPFLVRLRV